VLSVPAGIKSKPLKDGKKIGLPLLAKAGDITPL
jgi:hypothetical protein